MSKEENIKHCLKTLIEKIESDIEYMTSINIGLNYDSEYINGKIDGLCEISGTINELYSLIWEET